MPSNITVTATTNSVSVNQSTNNVTVTSTPTTVTVGSAADTSNTAVRAALSATDAGGDGSFAYNNTTGVFTYTGPNQTEANTRVAGAPTQVRAHIGNTSPILYNSSTGVISIDSSALFTGKNTDDLSEGSTNFYFTTSRFNSSFGSKDTDDLSEGTTNLYFTDARANVVADARIAASGNIVRTTGDQHISGIKQFAGNIQMTGNDGNFNMRSFDGSNTNVLKMVLNGSDFETENAGNVTFASPRTFSVGRNGSDANAPADFNRPISGNKFYNRD